MPAPVRSTLPADSRQAPVLGSWRDGRFDFTSPGAREAWHRSAFAQGIDPESWHLGAEVDDKTHQLIAADLAGPTPPFYRGPDGRPRFGNLKTIERSTLRDIRARSFDGKSMTEIEAAYAGGKLPGEDEAVGHLLGRGPTAAVSSSFHSSANTYGNQVIIKHADGTYTQYAHMEPALDKEGKPLKDKNGNDRKILREKDKVKAGQQIGSVGRTGNVGDPTETDMQKQPDTHLHFEVRYGDTGKNPSKRVTIHPAYCLPIE